MSAERRNLIQEYLVENFLAHGHYSSLSIGKAPAYLPGFSDPEMKRCLFLERGEERFLVVVHSDARYLRNLDDFETLMGFMTSRDIATVSVFDDQAFYNWDRGVFKSSRVGRLEEVRKRIKLLGLERVAQKLGPVTYYKNQRDCLEVVRFTDGVIADYSQSRNDFARRNIQQRELLTVMDAEVLKRLDDFELVDRGIVRNTHVAGFEDYDAFQEKAEPVADERTQHLLDELAGGNEEIRGMMNWEDIQAVRKFGGKV
ncbi:hypothetical protein HZA98_00355 [Candidatus Woesearchaeota archaeon]|nr:hypothetical protein [Candidatus Woesearchaeota archaeon]